LRRILGAYIGYYNEHRTHLSLDKDAPTGGPSNGSVTSPLGRSLADFIINIAGYSFW
jgi:hypothetical protein